MNKPIRFEPQQVPGRGWTVVKITGSKRTGREIIKTDAPDTYTLAQAQSCASSMTRDHARHGD